MKWSLTRSGRYERVDCTFFLHLVAEIMLNMLFNALLK